MKEIKITCHANGTATVTTTDTHISNEDLASKIIVDFTELEDYTEFTRWLGITFGDGTSQVYDLGIGDSVELEMGNEMTVPGYMTLAPFTWDGLSTKVKFIPDKKVMIHYHPEAGEVGVALRDDYIASLVKEIDDMKEEIAALNDAVFN